MKNTHRRAIRILTFLFLALLVFKNKVFSQANCTGMVNLSATSVCLGDSVFVQASNSLFTLVQGFDFNSSTLPSGWATTGTTFFSAPCGPSLNNTPYYWASTAAAGTIPGITTVSMDVSQGGYISFDMIYAIQGGASPCEGPDQYNEGVSVQYSINGGTTWFDIQYYAPNGTILTINPGITAPGASGSTPFTVWNSISIPIPSLALTTNTMFRWTQLNSSGSCCDNWGLDNISFFGNIPAGSGTPNSVVNWSNGLMNTNSFYIQPTADTVLVAYFYDTLGVFQCQTDTFKIKVHNGSFTYSLPAFVNSYCAFDSTYAAITNISTDAAYPFTYNWSNGDTSATTYLHSPGVSPAMFQYYVDITDNCGFTIQDSVLLNVNQTLNITSFNVQNQINCLPNGSAMAIIIGNQGTPISQWTNSSGQVVNPIGNNANNLVSGWYDVTVTDNVCQVSDSVFVPQTIANNLSFLMPDTVFVNCPGNSVPISISAISGNTGSVSFNWSNGGTLSFINVITSGALNEVLTYSVVLTDFCGNSKTDSVKVVVDIDTATQIVTSCGPFTWRNGTTYTTSNFSATYMVMNSNSCDSLIYLNLTINPSINQTITNNANTLTTNYSNPNTSYQWIDCLNSNAIIPGATNASYTAQINGQYAVIVTDNSCTDTSACEIIANVGNAELGQKSEMRVYPNPNNGAFTILIVNINEPTPIAIVNSLGQIVYETYTDKKSIEINRNFASGLYFVKINEQQVPLIIE